MEKKQPDLGDTPGFAKALAELKRDVPSGDDPLYFDVTKGARLLTREEKHKIFDAARGRGASASAHLPEVPTCVVAPVASSGPDGAPVRVSMKRARLWRASGGLTAVALIVVFAWLMRTHVAAWRSADSRRVQGPTPTAATDASTLPVETRVGGDTPPALASSVMRSAASAPPAPATVVRTKSRSNRPAPEVPLSAASAAERPTIENPERY